MKTKVGILLMLGLLVCFTPSRSIGQNKYMTTKYAPVDSIPAGKAVIYIYRVPEFTGSAVHYSLSVNDAPLSRVHMYNGGYFVYFADPGKHVFTAEVAKESTVTVVNAEAGQTYFIKASIRTGTWVGRPWLETVDSAIGEREIVKCKLLVDR